MVVFPQIPSLFALRLTCASACGLLLSASATASAAAADGPVTILDGSGVWRVLHSWNAPLVQTSAGVQERRSRASRAEPVERPTFRFLTLAPPVGWTTTAFDDTAWPRRHFFAKYTHGEWDERAGGGSASPYLRELSLRGKFTVSDPAAIGRLWLNLAYRGGVAVYLNGHELARGHLPAERSSPARRQTPIRRKLISATTATVELVERPRGDRTEVYPLRVRKLEGIASRRTGCRKGRTCWP